MTEQALIGLGLAIGKSTEKGHQDYGTVLGFNNKYSSPAKSTWNVFTALGMHLKIPHCDYLEKMLLCTKLSIKETFLQTLSKSHNSKLY